jgi:hypothetical protein
MHILTKKYRIKQNSDWKQNFWVLKVFKTGNIIF